MLGTYDGHKTYNEWHMNIFGQNEENGYIDGLVQGCSTPFANALEQSLALNHRYNITNDSRIKPHPKRPSTK